MVGVWTYPPTLCREGLDSAFENLASRGVEKVAVAAHHHSARVLQPRFPESLFERWPAGCYFDPDESRFADAPIRPLPNEIEGVEDPLAEIADAADEYGLRTSAWTVYCHNSRLGAENPQFRTQDCFGNAHEHAFCPSNREVREYFAGVTAAVADRGVDAVELEKVRFPSAFHGHDTVYGHDARQALASETDEYLLSQCFCEACRREARDHAVEMDEAEAAVRELVEASLRDPTADPLPLADLVRERPVLRDLFEFRAAIIDSLLGRIADAAGDAEVNAYVRANCPNWPAGRTLDSFERHADRLTSLCYVGDPKVARERLASLRRSTDLPIDAGVSLDPQLIDSADRLSAVVGAIRDEIDGEVSVYNHAMLTEAQLDWVARIAE